MKLNKKVRFWLLILIILNIFDIILLSEMVHPS